MKRIEQRLFDRMDELSSRKGQQTRRLSFVSARQFYGMDINPFAVELAKVTMMIARKLAIDELHMQEPALPLDNLDQNFTACDALITFPDSVAGDGGGEPFRTPWPEADVIIGNPPFLGSRYLAKERGYEYANTVYELYPEVPKMADYCVYWFRRAHDHLPDCTTDDPTAGRAGLVGTQNIRNNESREGGLDHIVRSGTVVEAVDNQPWSGEAHVHVSIANWVKHQPGITDRELDQRFVVPAKRKLWFEVPAVGGKRASRKVKATAGTDYELDFRESSSISSALSDKADVSGAVRLGCNRKPKRVFQGQNPANTNFMLSRDEGVRLIQSDSELAEVLFPYMTGDDLLDDVQPSRYVIDFAQRDVLDASRYSKAFAIVEELVMPMVMARAEEEKLATGKTNTRWTRMAERWWQFRDYQPGLMALILSTSRYVACSRTTKRPVFAFVSSAIHPDTKLMCFAYEDDYAFGVIQSNPHWEWLTSKGSRLKTAHDRSYSSTTVWETFPWPQSPTAKQIDAVAEAGREVRRVREDALAKIKGGLRAVYRTLELPGKNPLKDAHAALDAAVLKAYGFASPEKGAKKDLLKQLLDLNLEVAARIDRGEPVTAPGVPPDYPEPEKLITDDCIRPA